MKEFTDEEIANGKRFLIAWASFSAFFGFIGLLIEILHWIPYWADIVLIFVTLAALLAVVLVYGG